ncbi:MAG: Na/Pi cotransporter family protein [Anaerovoracaceae bacterium]|jgi:phosphate:Na+ symporter
MFIFIFQILGGAGLLLYGIEIMKDSLEWISQGRGQRLLEVSGKNTFMSILAGIIVTAINQKSSATTVMVVGLVNAGMMSLVQAAGVIMGANIGTTITAQLLAFRLEFLAPCIVGVAVIFWKYSKTKRVEHSAEIFIGFGIMFIGMIFMESGMSPLSKYEQIQNFLAFYSQPDIKVYLTLIVIGFLMTAIVRSSSLLTGVMIAMSAQGLLSLEMAIPLIMGINIGKCLTVLWSSRGAGRTAKRAAVIHILYNLIGTVIVVLFLREIILDLIIFLSSENLPRQIANTHTLFNVGSTVLCLPFIRLLVKASDRIVPIKRKEDEYVSNLDVRMLETPGLALAQTYNEIINLAKISFKCYMTSFRCVVEGNQRNLLRAQEMENIILGTQKEIELYLVKLAQKNTTKNQHEMLNLMLGVSVDIERISDLSINIAELAMYKKENGIQFSQKAKQEMEAFHEKIHEIIADIMDAIENRDVVLANNILSAEINIKNMEVILRENHIERLSMGICNPGSGVMFMDIINSMEHVAEHIKKIGYFVVEISKY